jgi:hypothetical protein
MQSDKPRLLGLRFAGALVRRSIGEEASRALAIGFRFAYRGARNTVIGEKLTI